MNYYISDTHFDHKNVIAFDSRPFFTVTEMNAKLIENWNNRVTNQDMVYILGDFHWGKTQDWLFVLRQLNGQKTLVRGNHDLHLPFTPELSKCFADVKDYKEIDDNGRKIVLSHFPMPVYKNMYYGWYHLYGHVHTTTEDNMVENFFRTVRAYYEFERRAFNVGCMKEYMGYTPRTLDEIIEVNKGCD